MNQTRLFSLVFYSPAGSCALKCGVQRYTNLVKIQHMTREEIVPERGSDLGQDSVPAN